MTPTAYPAFCLDGWKVTYNCREIIGAMVAVTAPPVCHSNGIQQQFGLKHTRAASS